MLTLTDTIEAVKAITEAAEPLNYRDEFSVKYPSLTWLFDDLLCSKSPEGAYWSALNLGKIFDQSGIFEEKRNGTYNNRNRNTGIPNPGGKHLSSETANPVSGCEREEYHAQHLHREEAQEPPVWVSDARFVLFGV